MIVNETVNDVENNTIAADNNSRKAKIIFLIAAILFIVVGIAELMVELYVLEKPDFFLSSFLMLVGVIFLVFVLFFYKKVIRASTKKLMQGKESTNVYTFTEEGYSIETTLTDGTTGSTHGNYNAFTVCKEFSGMWLLYLNAATLFIIVKSGMREGTAEELTELLKNKLGAKYKCCCKK